MLFQVRNTRTNISKYSRVWEVCCCCFRRRNFIRKTYYLEEKASLGQRGIFKAVLLSFNEAIWKVSEARLIKANNGGSEYGKFRPFNNSKKLYLCMTDKGLIEGFLLLHSKTEIITQISISYCFEGKIN